MQIDFIKELENSVIPTIQRMIEKEQEHNTKLRNNKNVPSEYIKFSDKMLNHYTQRLNEYTDYVKVNKK